MTPLPQGIRAEVRSKGVERGVHRSCRLAWIGPVLLTLTLCGQAFGLDHPTIAQFLHTSWTVLDGAPGSIDGFAQTTDGFLWLRSLDSGLVRFDGVRFERYQPLHGHFPSKDVSTLMAMPDGGLWIGFRT